MAMHMKKFYVRDGLLALAAISLMGGMVAMAQNTSAGKNAGKGSDKNLGVAGTEAQAADAKEWPTFGHDSGGMRFSPLTQITPANVSNLSVAWVYHMKQSGDVMPQRRGPGGPPPGEGGPGPGGPGGPPPGGQADAQAAQEGDVAAAA